MPLCLAPPVAMRPAHSVQNSTPMWETLPQETMNEAMALHNTLGRK